MRKLAISASLAVGIAMLSGVAAAEPGGPAAASTGLFGTGDIERVTLGLGGASAFRVFTLENPLRVIIDLPEVEVAAPPGPVDDLELIKGLRFGELGAERGARIVVDLRRPARVDRVFVESSGPDARFVLDLAPTDAAEFAALSGWPEGAVPVVAPPAPGRVSEGDRLIIVDPGHGGADPGAISRGVAEKDLSLAYARALMAAIAEKPGFAAALTRNGDEFLTLRSRVALARRAGASAFISLHADALASGQATGASVFVLSENASGRAAAALAAGHHRGEWLEGAPVVAEESDVTKVLLDLARRRTDQRSRTLGEALVERLRRATPVLEGRELQSAGFMVLRAPDVPSALVELGFMSNEEDRARLLSVDHMNAVVSAIADAVVEWAENEAR